MSSKPPLIFDLDGTLIDSSSGVLSSISYAMEATGQKADTNQIQIGPPLLQTIRKLAPHASKGIINKIETEFIAHYDSIGCLDFVLYPDITPTLEALSDNFSLLIATNKRQKPVEKILQISGLDMFFEETYCIDSHEQCYKNKTEMLRYLIAKRVINESPYYIGDTFGDYLASINSNCKFIGVTWGYDNGQLDRLNLSLKCKTPREIISIMDYSYGRKNIL